MFKAALVAVSSLSLLALAEAAPAASVVTGSCQDLSASGSRCLFNGNINGNASASNENSFESAEASYNALAFGDIELTFITSSDDADFSSFGSFTGANSTSGTFNLPGYDVQFLAVKAGPQFFIYNLDGGSTGTFSTVGLDNGRGNARALSHLAFFGSPVASAVPEPTTWAMMLGGFGLVGSAMRRVRRDAGRALAYA